MLEKLKKVEEKFDFISAELCKSEVVSDMELYKKYMQELKHLSPIVEKYREYKAAENNAEEAKGLLEESGADPELKELARAELEEATECTRCTATQRASRPKFSARTPRSSADTKK